MELLFEFLAELIGELITEIIKNKKISLWIRIPLLILFSIVVIGIIILLGYLGIMLIKESILGSIIFIIFSIIFLVFYIIFIYKLFKK